MYITWDSSLNRTEKKKTRKNEVNKKSTWCKRGKQKHILSQARLKKDIIKKEGNMRPKTLQWR